MKRRRNNEDEGSLDLLLDTICNVFGGIVFIAILVALLTSNTVTQVQEQADTQIATLSTNRQTEALQFRAEQLAMTLERLHNTRAVIADDVTERGQKYIAALRAANDRARDQRTQLQRWLHDVDTRQRTEIDLAEDRLSEGERRVEELRRQLEEVRAIDTVHVRLPMERQTERYQIALLLQNGKVHVIPGGRAGALLATIYPFKDVDVQPVPGFEAIRIGPSGGGGFRPDADGLNEARARSLLGGTNPDRHFFDMFVAADSVDAFRHFRDAVVHRGYRYNIRPMTEIPLTLAPTDKATVQ